MNKIEIIGSLWRGLNDCQTFIDNIDENTFNQANKQYSSLDVQYHQFSKLSSNFADLLELLGVDVEIKNNKKYKITIEEVSE